MEALLACLIGLMFAAALYLMLSGSLIKFVFGFTLIGNAVNLSSRLQALSQDGQILMDEATKVRLGDAIEGLRLEPLGAKQLKGIDQPVEVFEISSGAEPAG